MSAWAIMVTTPPPSETFEISRHKTFGQAKDAAVKWAGSIDWTVPTSGIAATGEQVDIEPTGRKRRGKTLAFPRWDEIFETGVFEQWIGPELGFRLNEFDEVVEEDRTAFRPIMEEIDRWLLDVFVELGIHPYSSAGRLIYPTDVNVLIGKLKPIRVIPEGPKEWSPEPKPERPWMPALARALRKMVEEGA